MVGVEHVDAGTAVGDLLFHRNPDVVLLLRRPPGGALEVVRANEALERDTGWAPADVVGRSAPDLLAPDVQELYDARLAELAAPGDVVRFEVVAEVPAGRRVYDMTVIAVPPVDGVPHYLQVGHDMTVAYRTRLALEETQALARIGHWTWDLSTDHLYCTEQVTEIYGLPPSPGPQDVEVFWGQVLPEDEPALRDLIGDAVAVGGAFESEYRVLGWTDEPRTVHTRGRCVVDDAGAVLRLAGTVQDVTDERAAAQAAREAELQRARQAHALELNDDVVQGLTAARLALMVGDADEGLRLLDRTTEAARRLVGELLATTTDVELHPGALVRDRPSSGDGRGA